MKKLKLNFWHFWIGALLVLIVLSLVSCQPNTPIINHSQYPFIVSEIEVSSSGVIGKNFCYYYGHSGVEGGSMSTSRSKITLPCGLYQIGDTIKIKDFITKQTDE